MAKLYSVMDNTEEIEIRENKEMPPLRDITSDVRTPYLVGDTETQTLQLYADDKPDYFDGYYEVGVLMALGIIIGILLFKAMVGRWHT